VFFLGLKVGYFDKHFPLVSFKGLPAGTPYNMVPTLASEAFITKFPNPFRRLLQAMVYLLVERWKYYFAWKVSEGACQMAGFGFEGFDEQGKPKGWGGVTNIGIWEFETSWNMSTMSHAWNKGTSRWLALYTYQRTGGSLLITYFVSAFWHGLYPGFYVFFMSVPLVTWVERLARAKLNPILIPNYNHKDPYNTYPYDFKGIAYCVVSYALFFPLMNYLVSTFALGTLDNCLRALGSYYHAPHLLLIVAYLFMLALPAPKSAASFKKKQ